MHPVLLDLIKRQCRVWILNWHPFARQEVVIDRRFTEELDDARMAYQVSRRSPENANSTTTLGDHYLRLICSSIERPSCCHDKFGGPSMYGKLEHLLLATKAATTTEQIRADSKVREKVKESPFLDIFTNANNRHNAGSKLREAILSLDNNTQRRPYGLIWNGDRGFRGRRRPVMNRLSGCLHTKMPKLQVPKVKCDIKIPSIIRDIFVDPHSTPIAKSPPVKQQMVSDVKCPTVEENHVDYQEWLETQRKNDRKGMPAFSRALNGVSLSVLDMVLEPVREKETPGLKLNMRVEPPEKGVYNAIREHIKTWDPHPLEKGKGVPGKIDRRKKCKCLITWDDRPLPVPWHQREYFSEDEDPDYVKPVLDSPRQSQAKLAVLNSRKVVGCTDDFLCEPCEKGMITVALGDTGEVVRVLGDRSQCIMHKVNWQPLEEIIYHQMIIEPLPHERRR